MQLQIVKPFPGIEYAYSNNTKLVKEILSNRILIDGKFHILNVFDDVNIKIALRDKSKKDFRFEQIDALILDAIGSLYDNGIYYFTTDMIARMIYQNVHHRVTAQVKQNIQVRIDAMLDLQIRLNIEDEYIKRESIPKDIRLQKKQYTCFLPLKPIDVVFSANSRKGKGYHLYQSPLIWEYGKYTKQIVSFQFDAFSFLKRNITIESLLILRNVYRRIETMKNTNNNVFNRKICLYRVENKIPKGLLPECNINPTDFKNWNDKRRKICQLVELFLDYSKKTKEKQMRIKDYKYYCTTAGEGYEIVLYGKNYYKNHKK